MKKEEFIIITSKEAIKRLKESRFTIQPYNYMNQALDMAITALEKQEKISRTVIEGEYFCPRCNYLMMQPGYCKNCGQNTY